MQIWAEMSIDKSNDKTVIFTASDADGQPKIYLVMVSNFFFLIGEWREWNGWGSMDGYSKIGAHILLGPLQML